MPGRCRFNNCRRLRRGCIWNRDRDANSKSMRAYYDGTGLIDELFFRRRQLRFSKSEACILRVICGSLTTSPSSSGDIST